MVFKNLFVLVLLTEIASALEALNDHSCYMSNSPAISIEVAHEISLRLDLLRL